MSTKRYVIPAKRGVNTSSPITLFRIRLRHSLQTSFIRCYTKTWDTNYVRVYYWCQSTNGIAMFQQDMGWILTDPIQSYKQCKRRMSVETFHRQQLLERRCWTFEMCTAIEQGDRPLFYGINAFTYHVMDQVIERQTFLQRVLTEEIHIPTDVVYIIYEYALQEATSTKAPGAIRRHLSEADQRFKEYEANKCASSSSFCSALSSSSLSSRSSPGVRILKAKGESTFSSFAH
jgi:hypothetical protein